MTLKMIHTDKAPAAVGPYSQAVRAGDILFCSGQIPLDPATGELMLYDGDAAKQTKLVMENLKAVLSSENLAFDNVIKTTIFLSDMENFGKVNEVYASYFGDYKPARACVAVKTLPKNVDVEIEAIAYTK
jgi:2-iminobutanoate/2-iminopropanoate deaminase